MTNKELINIIEIAKAEVEWDYPLDYQIAFDETIEIIKRMDKLSEVLTEAEQLHPYNEGWNDALDYIDSKIGVHNDN